MVNFMLRLESHPLSNNQLGFENIIWSNFSFSNFSLSWG